MRNESVCCGKYTVIYLQEVDGVRMETVVDSEDIENLKRYDVRWFARKEKASNNYYVIAELNKKRVSLHRILTNCPYLLVVDHINHDTLDNRQSVNLRVVTNGQNVQNRLINKNNISGCSGVFWEAKRNRWIANIMIEGKTKRIGYFESYRIAVREMKKARAKYHPFSKAGARLESIAKGGEQNRTLSKVD